MDKTAYINILDSELSEVKTIYTKYYRGKWYYSDDPKQGYEKQYYATKVKSRLYYDHYEDAERRAYQYNKHYIAAKYGVRLQNIPDKILWDDIKGTEIGQDNLWGHTTGDWLYEHAKEYGWDEYPVQALLDENMEFVYEDMHDNVDFFEIALNTPTYRHWFLQKVGYKKRNFTTWEFVNGVYTEVDNSETIADYGLFLRK